MNRRGFLGGMAAVVAAPAAALAAPLAPAAVKPDLKAVFEYGASKYGEPQWRLIGAASEFESSEYRKALLDMFTRDNLILKDIPYISADAAKAS